MKCLSLSATILLVMFVGSAHSQDAYDETMDLICSSIYGAVCDQDDLSCRKGNPTEFEVPKFLTLRFSKGVIELDYRTEKKRKMKMGSIYKDGTYFFTYCVFKDKGILMGVWNFVVTRKTGKLEMVGLEHGYSYLFNGACKKLTP